jgi:serine/threonine protein kinase
LGDDIVLALAEGRVVGAELACVEEHLHGCPDCRSVVAETAKFFQGDIDPAPEDAALDGPLLAAGTSVSRYVVTNVLGAGAAGVVYRAHDPQLRRKIALKLLRPEHSHRPEAATLETRLLREARAMAQLSHPNVVTVFDVGHFAGQIFLVMELVEGETLASWLLREHPWRERMRLFVEAARGLSAAHAVHIAHRDFKPANVLVGADGRVRVTDFGLARPWNLGSPSAFREGAAREPYAGSAAYKPAFSGVTATEAGGIAGTPAFMAPEQFQRKDTDARTDQFSFCVALYQALYGVSPFLGRTFDDLCEAVVHGRLEPPPSTAKDIPAQVFTVLKRGLSVDPGARFSDMEALVTELLVAASDTAPRMHRRVTAAVLSVSAALCAGWLILPAKPREPAHASAARESIEASAHSKIAAPPAPIAVPKPAADLTFAHAEPQPLARPALTPETRREKRKPKRISKKPSAAAPLRSRDRYDDQLKDPF